MPEKLIATREGYDQWSEFYDEDDNPLVRLDAKEVRSRLAHVDGYRILDVGCGTGRHALELARRGAQVSGVDFSMGMLEKARSKDPEGRVNWVCQDLAQAWPFPDGWFDAVITCLVLEHIRDLGAFFGEMDRVCREGGTILTTAMHPCLFLRGTRAGYRTPDGQQHRISGETHRVADYVNAGLALPWELKGMAESSADSLIGDCRSKV